MCICSDTPLSRRHVEYEVHISSRRSMFLTSGAFIISCAFHIQHTSQTTKSDAGPANHQPSSHNDETAAFIRPHCLSRPLQSLKHSCAHQPSSTGLINQDEPGLERLKSTSSSRTEASTRRGSERRTAPNGVSYMCCQGRASQ